MPVDGRTNLTRAYDGRSRLPIYARGRVGATVPATLDLSRLAENEVG
jgi:hypothetical protein